MCFAWIGLTAFILFFRMDDTVKSEFAYEWRIKCVCSSLTLLSFLSFNLTLVCTHMLFLHGISVERNAKKKIFVNFTLNNNSEGNKKWQGKKRIFLNRPNFLRCLIIFSPKKEIETGVKEKRKIKSETCGEIQNPKELVKRYECDTHLHAPLVSVDENVTKRVQSPNAWD